MEQQAGAYEALAPLVAPAEEMEEAKEVAGMEADLVGGKVLVVAVAQVALLEDRAVALVAAAMEAVWVAPVSMVGGVAALAASVDLAVAQEADRAEAADTVASAAGRVVGRASAMAAVAARKAPSRRRKAGCAQCPCQHHCRRP